MKLVLKKDKIVLSGIKNNKEKRKLFNILHYDLLLKNNYKFNDAKQFNKDEIVVEYR